MKNNLLVRRVISAIMLSLLLSIVSVSAQSANVEWSLTFDSIINNPNGSWGGDINVGAGHAANITLLLEYEEMPYFTNPTGGAGGIAGFKLAEFQIMDNTNGLSSARIAADEFTEREFTYNQFGSSDHSSGTASGSVGASFNIELIPLADIGNAGDPFPFGPTLDAAINSSDLTFVLARAPTSGDNIFGVNGIELDSGEFIFASASVVPVPPMLVAFIASLLCMRIFRRP